MEILVVAFVLENIAITFELSSVGKGLIGSASFFGELVHRYRGTSRAEARTRLVVAALRAKGALGLDHLSPSRRSTVPAPSSRTMT